ncbi:hypothetical protein [uncultured Sphaerochaeta sp.]|uniref:hypothetical protein n=1 Tax=uncultured Sphaerochaeta sp. TaxID=886478 RepID=UPI002634CE15|nr:hypothetical protein [uncultured Sphaerochaeta sp.]
MERSIEFLERSDVYDNAMPYMGRVFLKPSDGYGEMSSGGVYIPQEARIPSAHGEVLGAAPVCHGMDVGLSKGDHVFYMISRGDLDEEMPIFSPVVYDTNADDDMAPQRIDYKHVMSTIASIIQGKGSLPDIDYGKAIPFGAKVYIRVLRPDDVVHEDGFLKTKSGVILPDKHFSSEMSTGVIINMGPNANDVFVEDELSIGQLVMIKRKPSGSVIQEHDNSVVWMTNSFEVIAKWDERRELWLPVGGWVFLKEVSLTHKKGDMSVPKGDIQKTLSLPAGVSIPDSMMTKVPAWIPRNGSGVPIPVAGSNRRNFLELFGIIDYIGGGVTQTHPHSDKAMGAYGPFPVGRGDAVIHGPVINQHGEYVKSGAAMEGVVNGGHVYVVNPIGMYGFVRRSESKTIDELASELGIE